LTVIFCVVVFLYLTDAPPKAKKANYPNLQTFENVRVIVNKNKKILGKKFLAKRLKCYIKTKE